MLPISEITEAFAGLYVEQLVVVGRISNSCYKIRTMEDAALSAAAAWHAAYAI